MFPKQISGTCQKTQSSQKREGVRIFVRLIAIWGLFFLLTGSSFAFSALSESEIESCVLNSAFEYQISPKVIRAIIDVESKRKQYAVNVAGKSYYPDTYKEAMAIVEKNKNKSFDVGLMQVNKWWFDKYGYDYKHGFDACYNITLGSWILAYEINRNGYTWEAIGEYHSKTAKYKEKYIDRIMKALKD